MKLIPRSKRRVVIVDDSRTIQALLQHKFSTRTDFTVVGIASDANSAAELIRKTMPDIVTIDLCMPYIDGMALLDIISDLPRICKVVVSDKCAESVLLNARLTSLGASACLSKTGVTENDEAFFNDVNRACDTLQNAIRAKIGRTDDVAAPTKPTARSSSRVSTHFGFPIPLDEERRIELIRLKQLGNAIAERPFDRVTSHIAKTTGFPVCLLTFIDRDIQWIKSNYGLGTLSTPREYAFCNYTIAQSGTFIVPNAATDDRFAQNPLVLGAPHIRAYAGHPILADDGTRIGALCVIDTKPRTVTQGVIAQLSGLADIVGEMINQRHPSAIWAPPPPAVPKLFENRGQREMV